MFDPKTKDYKFIDTCFGTHHPQFGYDADNTLWLSGTGPVAGWINTKLFDETGDAEKAVGWSPFVLDSNGNGKLDEFGDKPEEGKDTRFNPGSGPYAVMPHPTDGSVWYTSGVFGGTPGFLRFDPKTKLSEFYALPKEASVCVAATSARTACSTAQAPRPSDRLRPEEVQGSAQRAERHRQSLPGGLHAHQVPGSGLRRPAEYQRRVELLHLGSITTMPSVLVTIFRSRPRTSRMASPPWSNGKMILMRVPYPMGYYAKGLDARIDDPNAGWKGRGLWSASGDRPAPWLNERGKGARPMAVHIQVRPDPLAH